MEIAGGETKTSLWSVGTNKSVLMSIHEICTIATRKV